MRDILLFVEGKDERSVLPAILERANFSRRERMEFKAPTNPEAGEGSGREKALQEFRLALTVAEVSRNAVGIILDADEHPANTWARVRDLISRAGIEGVPHILPTNGLVIQGTASPVAGCWLMPDNESAGSLEGLLLRAIAGEAGSSLRDQASSYVEEVEPKLYESELEPTNALEKAKLSAWLAVQERPGLLSGYAMHKGLFAVDGPEVLLFLDWLQRLSAHADLKAHPEA